MCFLSCRKVAGDYSEKISLPDLSDIKSTGALRIIITPSAFSYYVDKNDNEYGYDYDLARNLADYLDLEPRFIIAANEKDMVHRLMRGDGDIIASGIYRSVDCDRRMAFIEKQTHTSHYAVVQRRSKHRITSVLDLVGKNVYVHPYDRAASRLTNLNSEIGGGIIVSYLSDSVSVEQLVYHVSRADIDYAVVDYDLAHALNQRLQNIDISLAIGFDHTKSWAVRSSSPELLNAVTAWSHEVQNSKLINVLYRRYILHNDYYERTKIMIPRGSISPYDNTFRLAASELGWDWRMLAAVAYCESKFNPNIISTQGARGLMQLMPRTAARFGLSGDEVLDPDKSIMAGTQYIKYLDMIFRAVTDKEERIKFILAGYNSGPGHILDAMALTEKYGGNQCLWSDVVPFLLKKTEAEYYNDSVCRHGYFRGKHTVNYVDRVYSVYHKFCVKTH